MERLNTAPITSSILAGGSSEGRQATSADFGGGIAQGLGAIGAGLSTDATDATSIDQDKARIWASASVPEAELAVRQRAEARTNSLDPTAPDYPAKIAALTDQMHQDVSDTQQSLMDAAPDLAARQMVARHFGAAGLRMNDMAMQTQSALNANFTTNQVTQGTNAGTSLISSMPDNDTYARQLAQTHDAIMGLTTVSPEIKLNLLTSAQHQYSVAQTAATVAASPQAFLTSINLQGGIVRHNGAQVGGVPGQAPDAVGAPTSAPPQPGMLAVANAALAAGKSPEDALKAAATKFPDQANRFSFSQPAAGGDFTDNGKAAAPVNNDPNVAPMSDASILAGKPPLAGWANLSFGEKQNFVRQAEKQVGDTLATTRGQGTAQMQDAMSAYSNGQMYAGKAALQAQNLATRDPATAARLNNELDQGEKYAGFQANLAGMSDTQADATLATMKPPDSGEDAAVLNPIYRLALTALSNNKAAANAQPMDFAVKNGIAGAQPLDMSTPEKFGAGLQQRVATNSTMMHDHNAPSTIFTSSEIPQITAALGKLSSHDAVSYLGKMNQALGNTADLQTAMAQLGTKNPLLGLVGNMANTGANVNVGGVNMSATDIGAKILDGDRILNKSFDTAKGATPDMPSGASAIKINENQFSAAFNAALPPAAFQSPNATQAAGQQKEIFNAAKAYYVADAYSKGKPLDTVDPQGVANAVDAVTGGVAKNMGNGGTLMVPYGMPTAQFQGEWNGRVSQALLAAGHTQDEINDNGGKLRPINIGDGKYGFMSGTQLLVNPKTKQPVTVDYSQKAPAPFVPPTDPMFQQSITPRL